MGEVELVEMVEVMEVSRRRNFNFVHLPALAALSSLPFSDSGYGYDG